MITKESLSEQLKSSEVELAQAQAHVYRLDGIIQLLKHQIASFDEPTKAEAEVEKPKKKG